MTHDFTYLNQLTVEDLAQVDYLSRKPRPDHPVFVELERRANAAHDLAMSYRRQLVQLKRQRT